MNDVNREVAEKVMGWEVLDIDLPPGEKRMWASHEVDSIGYKYFKPQIAVKDFDPMHRIEHAWMVVEKFDGCLHLRQHNKNGKWEAFFCDAGPGHEAEGDTAQEAICKAALAAKEEA
ncbi:MAG: hypothetical protein WC444_06305 [Candidatus Paceibacterota bacterium]